MRTAMRTGILLFAVCLLAFAQPQAGLYCATKTTALSGAAEVITIQQPATGARSVSFPSGSGAGASIYSSADLAFSIERDGTAASSTALTVNKILNTVDTNTATAWHTSNVGAGTTVVSHKVSAGQTFPLPLDAFWLVGNGTTKNLTLRTASGTATVIINICWRED